LTHGTGWAGSRGAVGAVVAVQAGARLDFRIGARGAAVGRWWVVKGFEKKNVYEKKEIYIHTHTKKAKPRGKR
jgi:hypothetical protein